MFLEELQAMVEEVKKKIEARVKQIKQREKDYDELLELKSGLGRVLEQYEAKKARDRQVFQGEIFENNRCMQRFRDSMVRQLGSSRSTGAANSVETALQVAGKKVTDTRDEIVRKESEVEDLRRKLKDYGTQLLSAVSMYDDGGGTNA